MPIIDHEHQIQRPEAPSGFEIPLTDELVSRFNLKRGVWHKSGICVLYPCTGIEITNGKTTMIVSRESLQEKI